MSGIKQKAVSDLDVGQRAGSADKGTHLRAC